MRFWPTPALDLAREIIADLQRRLDDAQHDLRIARQDLLKATNTSPMLTHPTVDVMEGISVPAVVQDEIILVASNGAMARHLEEWARVEIARGTPIKSVVQRIRDGDDVPVPVDDE